MKKSNAEEFHQKNKKNRFSNVFARPYKAFLGLFVLVLLTAIVSCSKTDVQDEVVYVDHFSCESEIPNNSVKTRSQGAFWHVIYRNDYPSHLDGKTILIKCPPWLKLKGRMALVNAYTEIAANSTVNFTFNEALPHDAEILILKRYQDGCNASAGGPNDNGLLTEVKLDNDVQDQSRAYIKSLFMHEIGHCLGLWHPKTSIESGFSSVAGEFGDGPVLQHVMYGVLCNSNILNTMFYPTESATLGYMFGGSIPPCIDCY